MSQPHTATMQAPSDHQFFDPAVARFSISTGYAIIFLGTPVVLFLMGFIDPPSASLAPEALLQRVQENQLSMLLGNSICLFLWCLFMFWMAPILMYIRRMERAPILTFASLIYAGGGYAAIFLTPMLFALSAFRAEEALIVQTAWDFGMFMFIYSIPPFTFFFFIVAAAIFRDINPTPTLPRWYAFYSIFAGIGTMPSFLLVFFHDGPFAYNGIVVFWILLLDYFLWLLVTTIVVHKKLNEDTRKQEEAAISAYAGSVPAGAVPAGSVPAG